MDGNILRTVAITNTFLDDILDDVLKETDSQQVREHVRTDLTDWIENQVLDTLYEACKGYCEDVLVPEARKWEKTI